MSSLLIISSYLVAIVLTNYVTTLQLKQHLNSECERKKLMLYNQIAINIMRDHYEKIAMQKLVHRVKKRLCLKVGKSPIVYFV